MPTPPSRRTPRPRLDTAEAWWAFLLRIGSAVVGARIALSIDASTFGVEDIPILVFAAGAMALPIANVLAGMRDTPPDGDP